MKTSILHTIRAVIFPERCPYCEALVEPHEIACEKCFAELRRKHSAVTGGARGYRCIASFIYGGNIRSMLIRIKFRNKIQFIPQVAVILADDIRKIYQNNDFDLITAVPMHEKDLKKRGYNQSELLAKELSKLLDLPYQDTICKIKRTKKQHHLTYAERKTNLAGAFKPIDPEIIRGKRILLIDDIITSGYTLGTCCKTLAKAKLSLICCATIATAQYPFPDDKAILT